MAIERRRFRAVLDTNVIIAALRSKNPASPTAELLQLWEGGRFDLLYCADLRAEYVEKMEIRGVEVEKARRFLASLDSLGIFVSVTLDDLMPVIRADPDDNMIVACAVIGGASHIVTYDPHFAPLMGRYRRIEILDGLHFLYLVRGDVRG